MKLVFAGTPAFAAAALTALHTAGHDIALVLTQPDRPSGRGLKPMPSAVKRVAQALDMEIDQPPTLKDPELISRLETLAPDVMIVAAYGLIIPPAILRIPCNGCINIHASLLPRWRGAAPIQRAILAGDHETGISIMQMDAGLDTGPVLLREALPIAADDTAETLHDKLAALGACLVVAALARPGTPVPQDDAKATYASKIDKREAQIDWGEPAWNIDRKVRAFNPAPGAASSLRGAPLKIWRASIGEALSAQPGTVCNVERDAITVACGDASSLKLLEIQRAGGKRLAAAAFLAGVPLEIGERLA